MIGDKRYAEAMDARGFRPPGVVGERSAWSEAGLKRSLVLSQGVSSGPRRSENADTSSDKLDENSSRRKPKVSWARFVPPGLAGS